MQFIRGIQHHKQQKRPIAATIGNFDGVHIGHQALIKQLHASALKRDLLTAIILFEPQPAEFFLGEQAPARIYTLREKLCQLEKLSVDLVIALPFNKSMSLTSAEDFVGDILFSQLSVHYLITGEDFRFGFKRRGDFGRLASLGHDLNIEVDCFQDYTHDENRVSSTRIRACLTQGDFATAEHLLGRPYSISGRVMHGAKRGRQWGIPTANIHLKQNKFPLQGVYHVKIECAGKHYPGVANIGVRPTVDGTRRFLEVHIHDFDKHIYGEHVSVTFLHKLRDEIKFANTDDLIVQIRQDIRESKAFFQQFQFD